MKLLSIAIEGPRSYRNAIKITNSKMTLIKNMAHFLPKTYLLDQLDQYLPNYKVVLVVLSSLPLWYIGRKSLENYVCITNVEHSAKIAEVCSQEF